MNIKTLIQEKNIKPTTARVKILERLQKSDRPLCYEEIKHDISMDKATFYRNIARFEETGILNAFESNDKKRYFEIKQTPHTPHAHFVCVLCHSVACVPNIEITLPQGEIHNIIINGVCPKCQVPAT